MTLVIGLTGSIGTGKSTIAGRFRTLNIPVIDADVIAREVVEPGQPAYQQIVATFGEEILHEDGTLNRSNLGAVVFSDEEKRRQLNNIIHPEIRKEMLKQRDQQIANDVPCVVLDIPLLFESNLTGFVDKIIVVSTDPSIQLQRILSRDGKGEKEAKRRIASQIPVAKKAKQADAVIDNNGTIHSSYDQLTQILHSWNLKIDIKGD